MRELVLHCAGARADTLSDALLDAGALSVSVEDADIDTQRERPLYGEPGLEPAVQAWGRNRVTALLPDDVDPRELVERLAALLPGAASDGGWVVRGVPDTDWVRLTQSQFAPIRVGSRIWIVPSWHERSVPAQSADADERVVIHLDPGLAFGTGSHPTTRLCLEWLAEHLRAGDTVLDYGCGSGILAIAAKMLGAGGTRAVDIDEQAVESARVNGRVNGVDIAVGLPDQLDAARSGVVIANILSNPLKAMAPMLANRVRSGGWLVLSGVLERQAGEVARVYEPWLALGVWRACDGWVCLHGQRIGT